MRGVVRRHYALAGAFSSWRARCQRVRGLELEEFARDDLLVDLSRREGATRKCSRGRCIRCPEAARPIARLGHIQSESMPQTHAYRAVVTARPLRALCSDKLLPTPDVIRIRSLKTSSRAYIRYELIGCLLAGNRPLSSHRRMVGKLTPRSFAASAIVSRSPGSGCRRRAIFRNLTNPDQLGNRPCSDRCSLAPRHDAPDPRPA